MMDDIEARVDAAMRAGGALDTIENRAARAMQIAWFRFLAEEMPRGLTIGTLHGAAAAGLAAIVHSVGQNIAGNSQGSASAVGSSLLLLHAIVGLVKGLSTGEFGFQMPGGELRRDGSIADFDFRDQLKAQP